jgi:hypothetical protein
MLIISDSLVLTDGFLPPWSPLVGWHNLVTAANIEAGNSNPLYPISNLATTRTVERWQAANTTAQRIIVTPDYLGMVDYVAVQRHNFGSAKISFSVEVYREVDGGGPVWVEVASEQFAADDRTIIVRFAPQSVSGVALRLRSGTAPARAAILYVGKLLILEPNIEPDFTPLPYGRVTDYENDITENGDFLGRVVFSETLESTVSLPYLDPDWYREEMDAFIATCATTPFFFAWDPLHYPKEIGFAWIKKGSNPQPKIHDVSGVVSIQLEMGGTLR